jgi:signal transduction histidine kinase
MADLPKLKAKVRKTKTALRKAEKEVRKLLKELRKGTLDRMNLESGLKKIRRHVRNVPPHYGGRP